MKKIIGLTVAALMVMGLVGGGTWAYFSDTESTTGNVLAAGTLNLQVNSADPWASAPIDITNIAPGASTSNTSITVENTGNLDGDLYVRINGFTDGGGDNPEPEQAAETIHGVTDNISTMLVINASWNGTTAVTNLDGVTISTADGTWSGNYIDLAGGAAADSLLIGATLNSVADNKYQGDNCTFTIEFYLAQDGQSTP